MWAFHWIGLAFGSESWHQDLNPVESLFNSEHLDNDEDQLMEIWIAWVID